MDYNCYLFVFLFNIIFERFTSLILFVLHAAKVKRGRGCLKRQRKQLLKMYFLLPCRLGGRVSRDSELLPAAAVIWCLLQFEDGAGSCSRPVCSVLFGVGGVGFESCSSEGSCWLCWEVFSSARALSTHLMRSLSCPAWSSSPTTASGPGTWTQGRGSVFTTGNKLKPVLFICFLLIWIKKKRSFI